MYTGVVGGVGMGVAVACITGVVGGGAGMGVACTAHIYSGE